MKALLACGIALGILSAVPALAQVWNEVDDAGDLPGAAQTPTGSGDLTAIAGTIVANDADMYCVRIDVPANFSATTCAGTTLDTQLWLFFEDGRGVAFNDDDPGGCGLQSKVTGTFVPAAGQSSATASARIARAGGLISSSRRRVSVPATNRHSPSSRPSSSSRPTDRAGGRR